MEISELYKLFLEHRVITTDSRDCPKDSIFFALKGESFNGNAFAAAALEKGCAYAVVDRQVGNNPRLILVDDVLTTLQQLANYHRMTFNIPVIGITGTNGKTTTKELVSAVLRRKFNVLCTQGNFNNHIGVPLTLLGIKKEHEMAIIEMGANHPGEIEFLCNIANPTHGLITNVGKAHLEGFGSFEGVIKTKSELYRHLEKNHGTIFVNPDNSFLMSALDNTHARIVLYSSLIAMMEGGEMLNYKWSRGEVKTHLCGDYNFENLIAAITVGMHFMVNEVDIHQAISEYVPTNNRSQITNTATNKLIIDTYNANPTSMTASINNFNNMECKNYKIAILGDMLELGAESIAEHRTIVEKLRTSHINRIILIGPEFGKALSMGPEDYTKIKNIDYFATREELEQQLQRAAITNATILIKGSHGIALEKLVEHL